MAAHQRGQKTFPLEYRDATGYDVVSADDVQCNERLLYDLLLGTRLVNLRDEIGRGFAGSTSIVVLAENAASCASISPSRCLAQ